MKAKSIPISVTFRHVAPTDALRAYAEKKVASMVELVPGATEAHVILSADKHKHRQQAEILVHGAHSKLSAHAETEDLYASIDLAIGKLDNQIHKLRGRMIEAPRRATVARKQRGVPAPTP